MRIFLIVSALTLAGCRVPPEPPPDAGANGLDDDDAGFIDREECKAAVQFGNDRTFSSSPAGIVECSPGELRRTQEVGCAFRPNETACAGEDGECASDDDCGASRCLVGGGECACFATCSTDDDCADGEACACSAGFIDNQTSAIARNGCVPSECVDETDCGGAACGVATTCGFADGFFCHSTQDECDTDVECGAGRFCDFDQTARAWVCADVFSCP